MLTHEALRPIRRSLLALSLALALVLGAATLNPAAAVEPQGWDSGPDVTVFNYLLLILIIPLGLAIVITVLTLLPSLASKRGYEPGQAWRGEAQWFGGPTKGVKSADDVTPEQIESRSKDTGGTSANW